MPWLLAWGGVWFILSVFTDIGGAMADLAIAFAIAIAIGATYYLGPSAMREVQAGRL